MDRSKKLLNNSLILLVGGMLTKGLNFIMAPLFTRWLTTAEYGMFDLLATYATLLIPLLALGIHHAVFRFTLDANSKENISDIVSNAVAINLLGVIIYFIFIVVAIIINPDILTVIFQLSILVLAQTFQNYMGMFVRGVKKLKLYTLSNVVCTASVMIFVYVFVCIAGQGLTGIILGYSFGYIMGGMVASISTKSFQYLKIRKVRLNKIKEMLKYAIPMVPNSISWWIVNVSDRMIVSIILGVSSNAILAIAHKIPNLCTTLYDIFQTAWVENATEAISDKDWDSYFDKMLNIMGQFCISVSIIIVTTNFFLYDLLFTNDYLEGKKLVPIFALAIIFSALSQSIGSVFIAEYNSKKQGVTMLQAGMVNIIIHLLLINSIGIYASAASTLIAYIFLFDIRYRAVKMKYQISINNKTKSLMVLLMIFIIISYFNNRLLDVIGFLLSLIICFSFNKQTILVVLKKFHTEY